MTRKIRRIYDSKVVNTSESGSHQRVINKSLNLQIEEIHEGINNNVPE